MTHKKKSKPVASMSGSMAKATMGMGKGMSGMMSMPAGKGNKAYCPKISKLD